MTSKVSAHGSQQGSALTERPGEQEPSSIVDSMSSEARPRIDIDEALDNGWFEMWYQPKIDLKRKCLAGAEALPRLRHPNFGMMPPGSFVPGVTQDSVSRLTEASLISVLTSWSEFEDAGFNLHLSVNVPVRVLITLPIPAIVDEHRPRSHRWPGIIVEVTEDQIVRDLKLAQQVAETLRISGIQIAIDDFGSGYSSFSCLRDLPFVEIKLDSSFVRNCATDATNAAICQTAVDLAHRFGSAAVAEGIEAQADLQALMVMGCDFGQGDLIAPPMPQEEFLSLLRQRVNKARPQTQPSEADGSEPVAAPDSIGRVA